MLNPPPLPQRQITSKLRGMPLQLTYDPATYIGRHLYFRGIYEEQIVRKLTAFLKPGMTFLDVGANLGVHTVVAAHHVGRSGHVLSVEPQRNVCALLRDNIRLNTLGNVQVFQCALGSRTESRQLFQISMRNDGRATLALNEGESACSEEPVHVKTLDEVRTQMQMRSRCNR